jgi:hypothetical protein
VTRRSRSAWGRRWTKPREAAQQWRFEAATRDGQPIPGRVRIAVRFRAPVAAEPPTWRAPLDAGVRLDAGFKDAVRSDAGVSSVESTQQEYGALARVQNALRSASELEREVALHFLMPEVVRSVRVSPGSYDPRQGDFAVAGTVRLELGYEQPGLTAKAGLGSFGSSRESSARNRTSPGEQTFAAAEFYRTDGFGPARSAQRASVVAQSSFRLGSDLRARLLMTGYSGRFDSAGVLRLSDLRSHAVSRLDTYDPQQGGAS